MAGRYRCPCSRRSGWRLEAVIDSRVMRIQTLAELEEPDRRVLSSTPQGLSMRGLLKPEAAAEFQQRMIAAADLHSDVADGTRNSFERLRTLHSHGIHCYEAFTVARDLGWLLMEQALGERFASFYEGGMSLVHSGDGEEVTIATPTFDDVLQAVGRRGTHRTGWRLRLKSGELMEFGGSLAQLQAWARREGLLEGQRNSRLDALYRKRRNAVAHPTYHLGSPLDSAQTICALAEIINRLWGHRTPGGRLYPSPVDREVLMIAWADQEPGHPRTVLHADQLGSFDKPGDWTSILVLGVPDDELWDFDTHFERTRLPCDLLWGPGTTADARTWLEANNPTTDTVTYLDRLFVLRIHDGRVSLARRPEVAVALPPVEREGRWLVVQADFPGDAFAHIRHIKDGLPCPSPPAGGCPVSEVFDGDWEDMAEEIRGRVAAPHMSLPRPVRVPSRWAVAPDVESP